jgi:dihydroxy-acid dehydratase
MDAKTNIKAGYRIGHVGPEAAIGRRMDPVRALGVIEIGATALFLDAKLTDAELTESRTKWRAVETNHWSGALWEYAPQVGPRVAGSVIHPGSVHENRCHAVV